MYRMSAVGRGHALRGRRRCATTSRSTRTRCSRRSSATGPALTWIAYPNNPTGNLFPREAILRIVAASPGLVVVDEAYFPFAGGATLLDEVGRHPNLVLVRTVSKLGLAGLRLGLAIGAARLDRTSSRSCACPTT